MKRKITAQRKTDMKKRLFSLFLSALLLLGMNAPAFAANHFIDVADTAWYAEAVGYVEDNGLMLGTGKDYFEPTERVNRAMVVTVLYRLAGEPEVSGKTTFSDVEQGTWYEAAVIWAQQNSIAVGYDASLFGPMDPVTREQLVTILWRYVGAPEHDSAAPFADQDKVSDWAEQAVNWAKQSQIVVGVGNNRFDPKGLSTRAQLAQVLMNGMEKQILTEQTPGEEPSEGEDPEPSEGEDPEPPEGEDPEPPESDSGIAPGQIADQIREYTDRNGDSATIPEGFMVSAKADEQTIATGLVIIGPDGSEFVWIPTTVTELAVRDFGSYYSGSGSLSGYWDETELTSYREMIASVKYYGGFYMGRYEASYGGGSTLADYVPASKRVTTEEPGRIWVQFSPQDTVIACQNLYADNDTVQGFFPWGINWDTTLQWLIDSGCKTESEVTQDSTSWGNYSNDSFSDGADGKYTGLYEEAKANNIYDLAGNNWEWTQERYGSDNFVMRGGGYNLMGGPCLGSRYPAALRDPLPGNNHHPNVTFRIALYVK